MQRNKIIKYSIFFGCLTALVCIIIALIQYYLLGKSPFGRYKVPAIGINFIFIFISIWYYRIKNDGYLNFSTGVVLGFLTNTIGAFLAGLFFYIFVLIDNKPIELWQEENISRNEYFYKKETEPKQKEMYKNLIIESKKTPFATPFDVFLDEFGKKQIGIVAVSLISMAMRKIKQL